jgi:hypothetical protein
MRCHDALVSQRRIAPPHRMLANANADAVTRRTASEFGEDLTFLLVVRAGIGLWLTSSPAPLPEARSGGVGHQPDTSTRWNGWDGRLII